MMRNSSAHISRYWWDLKAQGPEWPKSLKHSIKRETKMKTSSQTSEGSKTTKGCLNKNKKLEHLRITVDVGKEKSIK